MSIASRIEEMETHIGDVYDTIDYSYDTTGVNKNIINIPKYLKKGYIDIINNGTDTLYNNFPKVSGIGSNLSLTPTYEAPMKLNEIQGDTLQDGTPTPDSPVPIQNVTGLQNIEVCGKNLFDGGNTSEVQNVMFTKNEDGSYDISGIASAQANLYNYVDIEKSGLINNEKYTVSVNQTLPQQVFILIEGYNGSTWVRLLLNQLDNTTSKQTAIINISGCTRVRYGIRISNGTNVNISNLKIQLEKGSTATSYEEYKGQSYEINLGKNLYDVSTCTNAYINSTGVVTSANTNLLTDYIKIDNTKKYTISLNTEFYFIGCAYYDKNKTYLSRDTINNSSSLTITIPNNTEYIRVWMSYATNTNISKTSVMQYEPMIEKGTQRTLYSEYFTPIELNKIGTYQDYIYKSNGDWYLHQEIGKVVLDGSENITNPSNTGYSNTILRFNITVADKKYGKSGTIVDDILSNNFTCEKLDYDARTIESIAGHAAEHIVIIFIDKSRLSTENVQGFKTWLSTHNTIVYYVLATPTDTLITNTELIEDLETLYTAKSQEGTTNISITSEDLEMILNISALRGEV